jgi:hypothetical protein
MASSPTGPLFSLGRVVATPPALRLLERYGVEPLSLLVRHVALDPGSLDAHDQKVNRDALRTGARIFSSYKLGEGRDSRVWIITDAADDEGVRASTCILTPDCY